ncbi:MAG TPA: hypothetical protein VJB91_00595 [Patescibacteria group bacterium]|nr:hypothetical protein [Patescibacteria group bacterium]
MTSLKEGLTKTVQFLLQRKELIFLVLLVFFLRLPSLFEPYWHRDEAITLTVGQMVRRGAVLYKDVFDNKPPLLYLTFSLAYTLFWVKLITTFFVLLTNIIFFFLSRSLFPKIKAFFLSLFFALLTSLPLLEANIANGEIYFLLFTVAGMFVYLFGLRTLTDSLPSVKIRNIFFLAGLLFSLGFLYKIPAFFDFLAVFFYTFFLPNPNTFSRKFPLLLSLFLGFLSPVVITSLWIFSQNAFFPFVESVFLLPFQYVEQSHQSMFLGVNLFLLKWGFLGCVLLGMFKARKHLSFPQSIFFLWFLFSIEGALLGGRPYTHYLIQVIPSFLLTVGTYEKTFKTTVLPIFSLLILFFVSIQLFPLSLGALSYQPSYYQNFLLYLQGVRTKNEFDAFFDPNVNRIKEISSLLQIETTEEEPIFVWGDEPMIYAYTRRPIAGRFTASYHVDLWPNGYEEELGRLQKNPPRRIVYFKDTHFPFPELDNLIRQKYNVTADLGYAQIYTREK